MSHPSTPADPAGPDTPTPTRRVVLGSAIPAGAAVLGMAALTAPRPARLGEPVGPPIGDPALTSALTPHLGGHRRAAVTVLEADGSTRFAGFGADPEREFEIGSVSKTFTGALLAEAIRRGEATARTTVEEILGERAAGSALADVTLAELATHTSGLPRLSPGQALRGFVSTLRRSDPYAGQGPEELIDAALGATSEGRGEIAYSNLGVALEGQLLAHLAGTDFATLLEERIAAPLGLTRTYAPVTPEGLRPDAPRGRTASGLPAAPWTANATAPAGGIRSTAADLTAYLAAALSGEGPVGTAASEVLHEAPDGERVAMNWFLDGPVTWHNGMTGGFASFVGFVPESGRGVVVLTDTARDLDDLGRAQL